MRLKVLLPVRVLIDQPVTKVVAEAQNGVFALLPRHIDFVAALVPGILAFVDETGKEGVLGIDEGTLVKCADEVLVSVRNGFHGDDLASLRQRVEREFVQLDEHQRIARAALARLEAGVVRRFIQLEERP